MILWAWLACTPPPPALAPVSLLVVDGLTGQPAGDVALRLEASEASCSREGVSDGAGRLEVLPCDETAYRIVAMGPRVLWPSPDPTVLGEGLSLTVYDRPEAPGVYRVGGVVERLEMLVDVRRVRPKGSAVDVAIPAVLPVEWLGLGEGQGLLMVGEQVPALALHPIVPSEGEVALERGGPLQPWFGLGVRMGASVEAVSAGPVRTTALPGAVLWTELPAGKHALWDGQSDRTRLLDVLPRN